MIKCVEVVLGYQLHMSTHVACVTDQKYTRLFLIRSPENDPFEV